jgi:SAM-dependent methyltransferase
MSVHDRLRCPVCGCDRFEELFPAATDEFKQQLYAAAVRCVVCSLGVEQTLSPAPHAAYDGGYDNRRDNSAGSNRWRRFHHDRAVGEDRLRQLVPVIGPPNNRLWVDVGCNNGALLVAARAAGWDVYGVEADEKVADALAAVVGLRVRSADEFMTGYRNPTGWDGGKVVSLFDVLEHLLDPIGALLRVGRLLSVGDYVVVEVPDVDSAEPGKPWRHRRISAEFTEHVWHFGKKSLRALFARFLPDCDEVHCATPVPTKLQMAWRKKAPAGAPSLLGDVEAAASLIVGLPSEERGAAVAALKDASPPFADLVQARIDRIRKQAGG